MKFSFKKYSSEKLTTIVNSVLLSVMKQRIFMEYKTYLTEDRLNKFLKQKNFVIIKIIFCFVPFCNVQVFENIFWPT